MVKPDISDILPVQAFPGVRPNVAAQRHEGDVTIPLERPE